MKTILCFLSAAFTFSPLCALARDPFPRPVFMPSTSAASKSITAYTAADIFGVVVTSSSQIPDGHPYVAGKKYRASLKTDWPGAKVATSIDALAQIVLDAPAIAQIRGRENSNAWSDLDTAWNNFRYILREVIDVPEAAKIDALIRIVNAQTDPMKKARAAEFGSSMFLEFFDPRLLAYRKEQLDNPAAFSFLRREERPSITYSARGEALRIIPGELEAIGFAPASLPDWTTDEATSCAALKTWMTANWAQITTKCAEAKAKPDRKLPGVNVHPWDARW